MQTIMIQIRRAKQAVAQAEGELEALMRGMGIKPDFQPKPPGRPMGSKNRPKTLDVAPGSTQDEVKAG
jgi:hypothetical protein